MHKSGISFVQTQRESQRLQRALYPLLCLPSTGNEPVEESNWGNQNQNKTDSNASNRMGDNVRPKPTMRHVAVVNAVYRKEKPVCLSTRRHFQRMTMAILSMDVFAEDARTMSTSTLVHYPAALAPRLVGPAVLAGTGALLLAVWPSFLVPVGSCALLCRRP